MKVTPYVYQKPAITAALKGLRGPLKRALVVMATGLGKTLTSAFIAKRFGAKRILFLVHNNFILKHAYDEFGLVFGESTRRTIYSGLSKNGAKDADIVFATWQTMGGRLQEWVRNHFDLIIVDEAHHTEAVTYRPTADYFIGARLAITATPDRTDDTDIRYIFGPAVINITLEEAIARGWLPRIEYHVITDESLDDTALQKIAAEIREGKKRFTMAEVNRRIFIQKRDVEVTRIINGYNEKAIVFCASIRHAERMRGSLKLARTFHSKKCDTSKRSWDENQATLDALKNGLIRRVCAVNAFNEGVNVPSIGLVAFCRVTSVVTIFRQQLGRGLRPGKDKLIVLDFVGNLERIRLVLETMNKISDLYEKLTPKIEREREGYTRERFEVSGRGFEFTFSDDVVDLMRVLGHCKRRLYETWEKASKAAKRLKIRSCDDYALRFRKNHKLPASPNQVYSDFPGWSKFLGRDRCATWQEASVSAIAIGLRTKADYAANWRKDPKLPSNPQHVYPDFPGWKIFLPGDRHGGAPERPKYRTWKNVQTAIRRLEIKSGGDYHRRFKADPLLVRHLERYYPEFPGWDKFFGKKK